MDTPAIRWPPLLVSLRKSTCPGVCQHGSPLRNTLEVGCLQRRRLLFDHNSPTSYLARRRCDAHAVFSLQVAAIYKGCSYQFIATREAEGLVCLEHPDSIACSIKRKKVGRRIEPIPTVALPTSCQCRNGDDPVERPSAEEHTSGRERRQRDEGDRAIVNREDPCPLDRR